MELKDSKYNYYPCFSVHLGDGCDIDVIQKIENCTPRKWFLQHQETSRISLI